MTPRSRTEQPPTKRPPTGRLDSVPGHASLDAHASRLHAALRDLKRVYQFRDRDRICCHDISVTQCWALDALVRAGPLSLNELAAELYLDKSTASRVVNALERKGYVRRGRNPADGRAVSLEITPSGARLVALIEREMVAEEKRLLAEFEPEVRAAMIRLIGRLAEAASAYLVTEGGKCCRVEPVAALNEAAEPSG